MGKESLRETFWLGVLTDSCGDKDEPEKRESGQPDVYTHTHTHTHTQTAEAQRVSLAKLEADVTRGHLSIVYMEGFAL